MSKGTRKSKGKKSLFLYIFLVPDTVAKVGIVSWIMFERTGTNSNLRIKNADSDR